MGGADAKRIYWGGACALEEMSARAVSGSGWHRKGTSSSRASGQGRRPLRGYSGIVSSLLLHGSFLGPSWHLDKSLSMSPPWVPLSGLLPTKAEGDTGGVPPIAKSVGRRAVRLHDDMGQGICPPPCPTPWWPLVRGGRDAWQGNRPLGRLTKALLQQTKAQGGTWQKRPCGKGQGAMPHTPCPGSQIPLCRGSLLTLEWHRNPT